MREKLFSSSLERFKVQLKKAIEGNSVDYIARFSDYVELELDNVQSMDGESIISMFVWFYYEGIDGWFDQEVIEKILWYITLIKVENISDVKVYWGGEGKVSYKMSKPLSFSDFKDLQLIGDDNGYPEAGSNMDEYFGSKIEDFYDCLVEQGHLEKIFFM